MTGAPARERVIPGVEGLRGVAAVAVLGHHVVLQTVRQPGPALGAASAAMANGLTLFFVLSGLLLYRPFVIAILDGRSFPSVRRYLSRRFRRVYPGYVVVLLVVALGLQTAYLAAPATRWAAPRAIGRLSDPVTLVADLLLVHMYLPGRLFTGIGPAWSLGVEVAFYVLLPVSVLCAAARLRRGASRMAAALLPPAAFCTVGVVTSAYLWLHERGMSEDEVTAHTWGQDGWSVLSRSILSNADLFGYGMLAAVALTVLEVRPAGTWLRTGLGGCAGLLGLATLLDRGGEMSATLIGVAVTCALLALVAPFGTPRRGVPGVRLVLCRGPLPRLGLISYGVYLWHVPVIWWLAGHSLLPGPLPERMILVVGVTVCLATATYRLVEKPAMR